MEPKQLKLPGLFNVTYLWPCSGCHTPLQVSSNTFERLSEGSLEAIWCDHCLDPKPPAFPVAKFA